MPFMDVHGEAVVLPSELAEIAGTSRNNVNNKMSRGSVDAVVTELIVERRVIPLEGAIQYLLDNGMHGKAEELRKCIPGRVIAE